MKTNPQHVLLFHHFRRFLERAETEGMDVAPLKGAHLVTSVYPVDEDRGMMGDVDFLVRDRDFERACSVLVELGFVARDIFYDETKSHEAGFLLEITEGQHILFEVHRFLVAPWRFPIDHESLWSRSVESKIEGMVCRRLASEDNFLFACLHAVLHRLMGLERAMRDLELLIRNGGVDLDVVVSRAREWKITRSVWLFLELIGEAAPDLEIGSFPEQLAPRPGVRRALRVVVPDGRGTRFAGLHHRVQAAALWPLVFDSPWQVARLVSNHPIVHKLADMAKVRWSLGSGAWD